MTRLTSMMLGPGFTEGSRPSSSTTMDLRKVENLRLDVLSSRGFPLCGVDVASPGQSRPGHGTQGPQQRSLLLHSKMYSRPAVVPQSSAPSSGSGPARAEAGVLPTRQSLVEEAGRTTCWTGILAQFA